MGKSWIFYGSAASGEGQGIYRQLADFDTLELSGLERAADGPRMGFQAVTRDGRNLYSCVAQGDRGAVQAFALDPSTGALSLLNEEEAGGGSLCYVGLDESESCVMAASYGDAVVSLFKRQDDGSVGPLSFHAQHEGGSGANAARQDAAHAHSIYSDPTGRFVLVCDLGQDKIVVYRLDTEKGTLAPAEIPAVDTEPGAGPRHLAFHPNGRWAYVINELNGTVTHYLWSGERGTLEPQGSVGTLPDGYEGQNTTAEIKVSGDGRFVYGSNRGHDSIVVYSVSQDTGALSFGERLPSRGGHPRNFNIDPSGRVLAVANRDSDNVVFFHIEPSSGRLEFSGVETSVKQPICVRFAPSALD